MSTSATSTDLQGLSSDFSVRTICLRLVSRATCPIRFLLAAFVSDRLQTAVSALASRYRRRCVRAPSLRNTDQEAEHELLHTRHGDH